MEATDSRILRMIERIWTVTFSVWDLAATAIKVSIAGNGSSSPVYVSVVNPEFSGLAGGDEGQVLMKASGTDYDYEWTTIDGGTP